MDAAANVQTGKVLKVKKGFSNAYIAARLEELAKLLLLQRANPFRVRAYERAAKIVRNLPQPVVEILQVSGKQAIDELKGIGPTLTQAIKELAETGSYSYYQRVRSMSEPESLLAEIPTIGKQMATHICAKLRLRSLIALERSLEDGSLLAVPGVGVKRCEAVRDYLLARKRAPIRASELMASQNQPTVAELLSVDAEFRHLVQLDQRSKLQPSQEIVREISRGKRLYKLHFSQSWLARDTGKTRDWVVIELAGSKRRRSSTVITAGYGGLKGHRVVRGRESECFQLYFGPPRVNSAKTH